MQAKETSDRLKPKRPSLWVYCWGAMWSWTSYLPAWSQGFPISKMREASDSGSC